MKTLQQSLEDVKYGTRNWYNDCLEFALNWLKTTRMTQFTSEDIIKAYREDNRPEPAELRVWGAVMQQCMRLHLIKSIGYVKYENPAGHGKPATLWAKNKIK